MSVLTLAQEAVSTKPVLVVVVVVGLSTMASMYSSRTELAV